MKRVKQLLLNLFLMTGAALAMRMASMLFNIWITNLIGAEGIGLFSLIMSVYGFGVTFATSAVNLAASRMTAEAQGRNSDGEIRAAMKRCIVYSLVFGCVGALGLFLLAEPIGVHALGDSRTVPSLRLLAVTLPMLSLSSALSGYFTAVRRVYKNVCAQIFEQLVKIGVTALALKIMLGGGIENACLAIVIGSVISELLSLIAAVVLYMMDLKKYNDPNDSFPKLGLTKKLLSITLPVSAGAYIRSGLVTIEHILIPSGLRRYGAGSSEALSSYGVVHGMVFPVILFPQAFLTAFAGLLVPEVSESRAAGRNMRISYIVSRVFQITLIFSIGISGIMIFFSAELGELIYESAEAGKYIKLLAPLIPVMYLDSAVDAMLKGLDEQVYSMRVNIIDAAMSVVLVYILLPICGVGGYIVMVYVTEIINAAMSITRLLLRTDVKLKLVHWLGMPLICVIGATAITGDIDKFVKISADIPLFATVLHIILTAVIYVILLIVTHAVTAEDIKWAKSIIK